MAFFSAKANAETKIEFFPLHINIFGVLPKFNSDLQDEKILLPKSKAEGALLPFSLIVASLFLGLFFIKLIKQRCHKI